MSQKYPKGNRSVRATSAVFVPEGDSLIFHSCTKRKESRLIQILAFYARIKPAAPPAYRAFCRDVRTRHVSRSCHTSSRGKALLTPFARSNRFSRTLTGALNI